MKSTNWKATAELVGIAAIVVSLVFVGVQLRLDREVAVVEARAGLTDRVVNLSELIAGRKEVWRKGLDGSELSDSEEIEFRAMVTAVQSHFFTKYVRWNRIGPIDPSVAAQSFAYALYAHPGLKRAVMANNQVQHAQSSAYGGSYQPTPFHQFVDGFLTELEESGITPDRQYVFW
jgi:hypothetical protein